MVSVDTKVWVAAASYVASASSMHQPPAHSRTLNLTRTQVPLCIAQAPLGAMSANVMSGTRPSLPGLPLRTRRDPASTSAAATTRRARQAYLTSRHGRRRGLPVTIAAGLRTHRTAGTGCRPSRSPEYIRWSRRCRICRSRGPQLRDWTAAAWCTDGPPTRHPWR
jgi:hypothetical protein